MARRTWGASTAGASIINKSLSGYATALVAKLYP